MINEPLSPSSDVIKPSSASPRRAILNAAIVNLESARQYLDKFLHWPDYILATHYYATALALTKSKKHWKRAEECFEQVESWLQLGDKPRRFDEARKRLRSEAMYNRAILLQKNGQYEEAKKHLQSLLSLVNKARTTEHQEKDSEQPLRGGRFAAEFALLMLEASDLTKVDAGAVGLVDVARPRKAAWRIAAETFCKDTKEEIGKLEKILESAEIDVRDLEKAQAVLSSKTKDKHRDAAEYAKRASVTNWKRNEASGRITKVSKDLAILRSMESRVQGWLKTLKS